MDLGPNSIQKVSLRGDDCSSHIKRSPKSIYSLNYGEIPDKLRS